MLILNRKLNESIMIGDVEVKVTNIQGEQVKLGIKAPAEILVYRKEIYDSIHSQNIAAVEVKVEDLAVFDDLMPS